MNDRQIARITRFTDGKDVAIVISDHRKARPIAPKGYPVQAGKSYIGTCTVSVVNAFKRDYAAVYDRR